MTHHHRYRSDISDWWCDDCDTVTDFCTELGGPGKPADGPDGPHPADCQFCAAGEPLQHTYEPPKEEPNHG